MCLEPDWGFVSCCLCLLAGIYFSTCFPIPLNQIPSCISCPAQKSPFLLSLQALFEFREQSITTNWLPWKPRASQKIAVMESWEYISGHYIWFWCCSSLKPYIVWDQHACLLPYEAIQPWHGLRASSA